MPILYRFLIVFGAIIAAGAVQSATAVLGVRNLSSDIDTATAVPIAQVDGAWRASEAFRESELFLKGALEGLRDQPQSEMIAQFEAVSAPIKAEMLRALGGDAASATDQNAKSIMEAITRWQADARILLGATPSATIPAPHAMDKRSAAIHASLQALIADTLHKAADARSAIHAQASKTQTFAIIYVAIFVCVGIGVAVPFALSLTRPLRRLQRRMLSMMDGDMDSPILDNDRRDEVGSIAKALLFMRESLTERQRVENEAAMRRMEQEQQVKAAEAARLAAEQDMIVTALATGLERLADGDLTFHLAEAFPAGYETLRVNFNNTTRQLQDMITGITDTTDALRSGTKDITQAADDLSRRTGAQAATLAETAASLEQIMTTVHKTADGAKQARDGVSQTKADAEQSGEVVREAIAAMSVIERSSREIGQIIGVIDEIAFQTNLLALNAGVEAARAGDSGRGFAVVASEVRALAQRSVEAAKQIKTLILTSTQQVDTGVKLVGQTGQVLGRIESQVGKVAGVVAEIAAAAQLQATSLLEVNTALNQMGQVTQQNASMAQESNAASHSLAQETAELARLTSGFQLANVANDPVVSPRRVNARG